MLKRYLLLSILPIFLILMTGCSSSLNTSSLFLNFLDEDSGDSKDSEDSKNIKNKTSADVQEEIKKVEGTIISGELLNKFTSDYDQTLYYIVQIKEKKSNKIKSYYFSQIVEYDNPKVNDPSDWFDKRREKTLNDILSMRDAYPVGQKVKLGVINKQIVKDLETDMVLYDSSIND